LPGIILVVNKEIIARKHEIFPKNHYFPNFDLLGEPQNVKILGNFFYF